ncbi:MAG: hypothetical protein EXS25_05365 [Pedosphaera sp.]|nr:hypothetical protein [Pedosphaera sp.]
MSAPPLHDGAVWISGDHIRAVGPWREIREITTDPVTDLGDAALFPGLINAHCHLDYTEMAGLLTPPRHFPDWIKGILTLKSQWKDSDFSSSWGQGARQLLQGGVTSVVNIESRPHQLAALRASTPLRVFSFLELTGVRSAQEPNRLLDESIATLSVLPPIRGSVGLSPHAPYSTTPELLRLVASTAKRDGWRLSSHVSESEAEFDMFLYRRGPMFDWLHSQRRSDDCGLGSPVQHMDRCGLLTPSMLAVHLNYLWNDDSRILATRGTTVVHCPRSHAYFGHRHFPREQLFQAGVPLCLGTDSLASVHMARNSAPSLSMIAEMQQALATDPNIPPKRLVQESTLNPARALGLRSVLGELCPYGAADMAVIPFIGPSHAVEEALIHHSGPVAATLIAGRWEWISPSWQDRLRSEL